jgi:starch phosphorylase
VQAGSSDLRAAAAALRSRLPAPLGALADIAYNYRWSWTPGGPELLQSVDPRRWELCLGNPVRLIEEVHPDRWRRLAGDQDFLTRLGALERAIAERLDAPKLTEPVTEEHPAAFFCAEFAIHKSLPVYSGGLGVLAGDILKEASDMGLPTVGIGLMYRHGYFRQRIDASGWQHEYWVETDPDRAPAALVTGDDGLPVTVTVPIADREVVAQIWRVDVGRVPLLLLDCDRDENHLTDRWITSRLYVGDPGMRLGQYAVLGIGGVRALHALGVEPGVVHLNEGHAALACLELVRSEGTDLDEAFENVRRRTVFTTHTPVPAGNDTYPAAQMAEVLAGIAAEMGCDAQALVRRGRTHMDEDAEPFGVTQFALRTSRIANGVSARHGEVAREMWQAMWPDRDIDDVPITSVTNGAHIPTWIGIPMRELLDRHLGEGWPDRAVDPATW